MSETVIVGLLVTVSVGLLLLLPLALKAGVKTFFKKDIRYFTCFWIVLVLSMILSGVVSTLFPLPV